MILKDQPIFYKINFYNESGLGIKAFKGRYLPAPLYQILHVHYFCQLSLSLLAAQYLRATRAWKI